MLDKFADGFLIYVGAPVVCFYAIMMSFLTQDIIALSISIIGTMVAMFLLGNGKR
jgi:hypothetical protein